MTISPFSPATIITGVWTASSRTLTGLVNSGVVIIGQGQTSIAANTTLSLQPAANTVTTIQVGVSPGAAGTTTRTLFDGTNSYPAQTFTAATPGVTQTITNATTVYNRLTNNDAVNAASYMLSGWAFN